MALILNIDTATEYASVCLSDHRDVLALVASNDQKNHASFVQPAIEALLAQTNHSLAQVDAVAVTAGPGSYTGLRVGLASAKGICYSLQKPLLLVNTLEVMAQAVLSRETGIGAGTWICPMIDARRMEVFTALYNASLEEIRPPHALIIDAGSFEQELSEHTVIFSGSGHVKLKNLELPASAKFSDVQHDASDLGALAVKSYEQRRFADLAYSEPLYVKEFFDTRKP